MKGKRTLLIGVIALSLCYYWVFEARGNGAFAMNTGVDSNSDKPVWLSETIPVDLPAILDARTSGGSIVIETHDRDDIHIDVFVRENGTYLEKGAKAPVEISITERDNRVTVTSEVTGRRGFFSLRSGATVSYLILVPEDSDVQARTSGGPIVASGPLHDASLITSGGPITVDGVSGDLLARTSGGPISIKDVIGNVSARTSGGGISMTDASGSLNARTSGGPINLTNVAGTIEAKTSGGSVNARVSALTDGLELSTSGGSITVYLPPDQGMDIDARGSAVQNNLDDFVGDFKRNFVKGHVKDGGIPVRLRTSGGSVSLYYGDPRISIR